MSANGPIDIEKTNLEAHVDLCAQRYDSINERLTKIESRFGELQKTVSYTHLTLPTNREV